MSSLAIGFIGLGAILLLIALRIPIAIVLIAVSIVGTAAIRGWGVGLAQLKSVVFDFVANWSLTAVPMFLLMGSVAHHSGISGDLFAAARLWLPACRVGSQSLRTSPARGFPRLRAPASRPQPRWDGSQYPRCCATATIPVSLPGSSPAPARSGR